ncbi:hypothetical protein SBADM41S_03244 [Streptomyces badius]
MHWSRHGEAYVTPVGERLVGVAVLSRDRRPYDQHLAAFPALAARLADGRAATPVRGACRCVSGRWADGPGASCRSVPSRGKWTPHGEGMPSR